MSTKLNQTHMDQISAMRIQAANGKIGYWKIYQTLAELLQSDYGYQVTDPTVLWLRGATEANAGRGSMSELIRVYSDTQAQLRYGENISVKQMQEASDEVAKNLLKNLFGEGDNGLDDYAQIPDIVTISEDDAKAVGKILFNRNVNDTAAEEQANSAWSGTLLFTQLTSDQSYRLMSTGDDKLAVDSLNDWRDVLYAYVSYEAGLKAAATEFLKNMVIDEIVGGNQTAKDISILGKTFYGYVKGEKTFIDYIATLAAGADNQNLLSAFKLINVVGKNRFLDMLMGVSLGKPLIGKINDDNFFASAKLFFQSPILTLKTQALDKLTLSELINLAKNDANIRAALNALSMISIETSTAVKEKFELYDPVTGQGEITEQWIEDRAKSLNYYYEYLKNAGLYDHDEFNFIDLATGIELKNPFILGVSKTTDKDYIFGTEGNDVDVQGGLDNDHIYGGKGNDYLNGGKGDDYLEGGQGSDELYGGEGNDYLNGGSGNDLLDGGAGNDIFEDQSGNDTYIFKGKFGKDTISDHDGHGTIQINDITLSGGKRISKYLWESSDGKLLIAAVPGNDGISNSTKLVISIKNDPDNSITVKNWKNGDFGIDLGLDEVVYTPKGTVTDEATYNNDSLINQSGTIYGLGGDDYIKAGNSDNLIYGGSGSDDIVSSSGNDTIYTDGSEAEFSSNLTEGSSLDPIITSINRVQAGGGDDIVIGAYGEDTIEGGDGADEILGRGGSDYIEGGDGNDLIHGDGFVYKAFQPLGWRVFLAESAGAGKLDVEMLMSTHLDSHWYLSANIAYHSRDIIFGGIGDDIIFGEGGGDYIDGGDGDDILSGDSIGHRIIFGQNYDKDYYTFNDLPISEEAFLKKIQKAFVDASGNDTLIGGEGKDRIFGGSFNDDLYGGDDDDIIYGDSDIINMENLIAFRDEPKNKDNYSTPIKNNYTIYGDDTIYGGKGNDTIYGEGGADVIKGGEGNDNIVGDDDSLNSEYHGADKIFGNEGNDNIWGGGKDDEIYGGEGDDYIEGDNKELGDQYHGADKIFGDEGNDNIWGGGKDDEIYGGEGDDYIEGDSTTLDGQYHGADKIYGDIGNDTIYGNGGGDELYGGDGNDSIIGNYGADRIFGGNGDDYLVADDTDEFDKDNSSKNELYGGAGNDHLIGGGRLEGGSGYDFYQAYDNSLIKDSDGKGIVFYNNKQMFGAELVYYSNTLSPLTRLDFSSQGYDLVNKTNDRLVKINQGSNYTTYKVSGDINFTYGGLKTEGLNSGDLDINFYVTVYNNPVQQLTRPQSPWASYSGSNNSETYSNSADTWRNSSNGPNSTYLGSGIVPNMYQYNSSSGWGTNTTGNGNDDPFSHYPRGTDVGGSIPYFLPPNLLKYFSGYQPQFILPPRPPIPVDPLTFDLNHDGKIETVGLGRGIQFDLDGNKFAENTTWITGKDGFLVLDLNNNGAIENGGELFGTDTLLTDGNKAKDGYSALAEYDLDGNKIINENDAVYQKLKIWIDSNGDGVSQDSELFNLMTLGITAISLQNELIDSTDENGVVHTHRAEFTQTVISQDGSTISKTGLTETLLFQVNPSLTTWQGDNIEVDEANQDILALPDIRGFGSIPSLHVAMSQDINGILKDLVSNFADTELQDQMSLTHQILLHWTNSQNIVDGNSQKLNILKTMWGDNFNQNVTVVNNTYDEILKSVHAQLIMQTILKPWMDLVKFEEERVYEATNPLTTHKIQSITYDGKAPDTNFLGHEVAWSLIDTNWTADFRQLSEAVKLLSLVEAKQIIEILLPVMKNLNPSTSDLYSPLMETLLQVVFDLDDTNTHFELLSSIYSMGNIFIGTDESNELTAFTNDGVLVYGLSGDDKISVGNGTNTIFAGDGHDTVYGGSGQDIIIGGAGNDFLAGGLGSDIYRFGLGWGQDIIQSGVKNKNDIDTINFSNINPADLILRKVGQDMVITHRVTGDQLTIQSQFAQYGYSKAIQFINFEDGTQWNPDDFNVQAVKGTELNDVIEGTTDHDVIHAGEGDDLIIGSNIDSQNAETQYFVYGEAGNDTINASGYLDGGSGNDEINGQGHLLGGDGDDILTGAGVLEGQNGNDILSGEGALFGDDGEDQLTLTNLGNDAGQLIGGTGNDTLIVDIDGRIFVDNNNQSEFVQDEDGYHVIEDTELTESERAVYIEGGQGNDTIYGSFGDEVYLFNLGDGQDILIERPAGQNYTNVAVSFDVLRFGENITTTDISLHRYGGDLVVKHANNSDQITIQNYFNGGHYKINEIQFADETIWNNAYLENHVTYHGTNSIDEVWGYRTSNEVFEMNAGDDKVYAGAGDDIIYGQLGNDTLWGQAGHDTLYGGTGADYLEGSEGNDTLFGDEDNDTLYGGAENDVLAGENGNDILSGGTGIDILNGGAGDDKYYYNLADGADVINQTGGGTDVLWLMDNGITRNRISFNKDRNDLVIIVDQNQNQSVRVVDHFLGGEKAISSVNANGQVPISAKDIEGIIKAQAYGGLYDTVLEGTTGAETIYGTSGNDLIQGLDGNDTIWAQAGNDRLEGGAGNDTLDGGDGNDSIFGGIGNDILIGRAGIDTLDGGTGDDKYYYYLTDGTDVINQTGGGTDVIWLMDSGITEDRIKFAKETNDLLITIDNNANQTIRVKDHFLGGEKAIASVQPNGGYAITAAQIANKVNGTGGTKIDPAGDTTYNYTSGALIINEISGTDKVVFATGTTLSQISSNLTKIGNDLLIKVKGSTANTVTVKNFFLAGNYLVETFQVATGEKLTAAQIFTAYGLYTTWYWRQCSRRYNVQLYFG